MSLAAAAVLGGVTLQLLGPPRHAARDSLAERSADDDARVAATRKADEPDSQLPPAAMEDLSALTSAAAPAAASAAVSPAATSPGSKAAADAPTPPHVVKPTDHAAASVGGSIAKPDPALQEPAPDLPGDMLPRVGVDGWTPRRAYAAGADRPDARPRVAMLIAGIGLSDPESVAAITTTPAAVSLAISPYAVRIEKLLEQARVGGHETLVSLPMEPQGYPLNNAGNRALLTGNAPALNRQRLIWTLARFPGYVGVTNALGGGLLGERFAGFGEQMAMVLDELAARGLLYIDARAGADQPARAVGRSADIVIDDPADRAEVEAKLAALEQQARDHGSALGIVTDPQPVTIDRVAAWTHTLAMRGLVLVPVSDLALPPPAPVAAQQ